MKWLCLFSLARVGYPHCRYSLLPGRRRAAVREGVVRADRCSGAVRTASASFEQTDVPRGGVEVPVPLVPLVLAVPDPAAVLHERRRDGVELAAVLDDVVHGAMPRRLGTPLRGERGVLAEVLEIRAELVDGEVVDREYPPALVLRTVPGSVRGFESCGSDPGGGEVCCCEV